MEHLNLSDRRRPTHTCDDMLNPVSPDELRELWPASPGWIELAAPIRQDPIRLPEPLSWASSACLSATPTLLFTLGPSVASQSLQYVFGFHSTAW